MHEREKIFGKIFQKNDLLAANLQNNSWLSSRGERRVDISKTASFWWDFISIELHYRHVVNAPNDPWTVCWCDLYHWNVLINGSYWWG